MAKEGSPDSVSERSMFASDVAPFGAPAVPRTVEDRIAGTGQRAATPSLPETQVPARRPVVDWATLLRRPPPLSLQALSGAVST
mgnify:CR=1 FL=1